MVETQGPALTVGADLRSPNGVRSSTESGRPGGDRWAQLDSAARDRLVQNHLPLVRRLSKRFLNCGEPQEDLVQIGTIGLIKAIEKFDPGRGFKFITYAVPVIVGEIKNYLRDHGWAVKVPRKIQRNKLAVQRAVDSLRQRLGRAPTIQEIGESTCLSQEEVLDTFELGNYGRPLSLDAEYKGDGAEGASSLADYLGREDPQFDKLSDRMDLNQTLSCLGQRERTIIYLKFYAGLSQTEIAKRIGISQMHVSRLQRDALGKLRQELAR